MGNQQGLTRRQFVKAGSVAAAAAAVPGCASLPSSKASGLGSGPIRIGLVGCGGRGRGAAIQCMQSSKNVRLIAMADVFPDHLKRSRAALAKKNMPGFEVTDDLCFTGFDAYQKLLETDIDLVLLATPPQFRPMQFEAAVAAGKHVFMEKPVAVDPVGIRRVISAGEKAKKKGLAVVAGTQRRHKKGYIETIKRIHDGAIGEIVSARCYWNQGRLWTKKRQEGWSDMEWQLRNWLYFCWASGDHIVEQHIHNIDVINWVMQDHPIRAVALGGRQARTGEIHGNIYDHFMIDFEYPNGAHLMSMCRQMKRSDNRISEAVVGRNGKSNPSGKIFGKNSWKFPGGGRNPYVQEHVDLIESIRAGEPLNEAKQVAESTMTAIMGREAAYTGKALTWDDMMKSDLDLTPPKYEFGDLAVRATPIPGKRR